MKKFATATVAALSIAATLALSAAPAEARFGRKGAFFGGLAAAAVGAAIIGSACQWSGVAIRTMSRSRPRSISR